MAGELLLDRPADGVLRLTISNPDKRNALDHPILDAIVAVLDDIGDARAVLLTGAEGMFSSGYDIGDIPGDVFAEEAERLVAHPFAEAL
ncbi:MAG TPA: enoyl-CoA hydratase-related protein, partial [Solirubrobacteraceae bacterium]